MAARTSKIIYVASAFAMALAIFPGVLLNITGQFTPATPIGAAESIRTNRPALIETPSGMAWPRDPEKGSSSTLF